jgi:ABC-2 type transport system ATP-binding protein
LTVADEFREQTMQALRSIHGDDPNFEQGSRKITIAAPEGAATLTQAVRNLDAAGIRPDDITLRRPTLDDVFLALTGETPDELDEPAPARSRRRERKSA